MKLAILGATGVVGRTVLECLQDHPMELTDIVLLASARSAGTEIDTPLGPRTVQEIRDDCFAGIDVAIFAAGGSTAKTYAPIANAAGCTVIDNSSAFRYDENVPLVVPEINADAIGDTTLIANPNCTTAIAAMALWPLHQEFGLKKVIVSTYQSASGAGQPGLDELEAGIAAAANGTQLPSEAFAHPLVENVIPRIDSMQDNGYTREEMKVTWETQKIFRDDSIALSCTAVRVPTKRAHCESIVIETEKPITPEAATSVLEGATGIQIVDDPENDVYPLPQTATRKYDVEVGRIRQNIVFGEHGLEFFVAGDQLLRGAAWNAVRILQTIAERYVSIAS